MHFHRGTLSTAKPPPLPAQVALEAELRGLNLQANALRKQHDRLVQDRLSSTSKLAQLKDSIKVSIR